MCSIKTACYGVGVGVGVGVGAGHGGATFKNMVGLTTSPGPHIKSFGVASMHPLRLTWSPAIVPISTGIVTVMTFVRSPVGFACPQTTVDGTEMKGPPRTEPDVSSVRI